MSRATFTAADGRALVVQMLKEIEANDNADGPNGLPLWGQYSIKAEADECAEEIKYRSGPQDNIVARYINAPAGDAALIEGFGSALSDWIGLGMHVGIASDKALASYLEQEAAPSASTD